jgi:PadR family transcriptional regulator, regulatory protein PadR
MSPHRSRSRRHAGGRWRVYARVERFAEPAVLLLLEELPAHGYELLERLPALIGQQPVEMGNLYRLLRALEDEGLVASEWDARAPGPAKRRYELTPEGRRLLRHWVDALRTARSRIDTFIDRYERREEVNDAPSTSRTP